VVLTEATRVTVVHQACMVARRSALIIRRPHHARCHQFPAVLAEAAEEVQVAVIRAAEAIDLKMSMRD
jgi:hypothetical protein